MKYLSLVLLLVGASTLTAHAQAPAVPEVPEAEGEVSGTVGGTESGATVGLGGSARLVTPGHISGDEPTTTLHRITGRERYELTVIAGQPVFRIMGRIEFYPVTIQGWSVVEDENHRVYLGLQIISATIVGQLTLAHIAGAAEGTVDFSRSYVSIAPQLAAALVHVTGVGSGRSRLPIVTTARARVGGGGAVGSDRDGLAVPAGGASFGADGTLTILMRLGDSRYLSSLEFGLSYDTMVGAMDRFAGNAIHTLAGGLGLYIRYLEDRAAFLRFEGRSDWADVNPAILGAPPLEAGPAWYFGGAVGIRFN